jgi:hypothetical protein
MKKILTILLIQLVFVNYTYSKKVHIIELNCDSVIFHDFDFFISDVQDDRIEQGDFGFIITGALDIKRTIIFRNSMSEQIENYTNKLIYKNDNSLPVKLKIKKLEIFESERMDDNGTCEIIIEYLDFDNNLLYMTEDKASLLLTQSSKNINLLVGDLIKRSLILFNLYDLNSKTYYDLLSVKNPYDSMLLCKRPKKGFYSNFREFQTNNPSIKVEFKMSKIEESGNEYERIEFKDSTFDYRILLDIIYGFSDGQNIYIKRKISGMIYTFIPIQTLGRYCYVGQKYDKQGVPIILPFAVGILSVPYKQDYIFNISSGNEHPLNDETMQLILASDKELLEVYLSQPPERREDMKLYWLNEFNKRYMEKFY